MATSGDARGPRASPLIVAAVFLVAITSIVGAPLARSGVLLPSELVYLGYPWRADDAHAGLGAVIQGPLTDTVDGIYPARAAVRDGLSERDLPLWDPYTAGGVPLGAIPSSGSFNPINSPYLVAPLDWAPALSKALELLVSMVATYAFARALRLSRVAGAVGAIVYAGSAFGTMWTNWPQSQVAALLPAVLWATELALRRQRSVVIVPLALIVASLLLGGFPAVAVHGLLLAGAYAVVRSITIEPMWSDRLKSWARAATGVALGVALAAFAIVPFAKGLAAADLGYRGQTSSAHLPVEAIVTILTEKALGLTNHGGYVGESNQVETVSFIGVAAVALAAAALVLRRPVALPAYIRGLFGVATVVIAVPLYFGGPALSLLQQIPTFDQNPIGRARAVLALCVAVLAAIGVDALRSDEANDRRQVLHVLLRVGGLVVIGGSVLAVGLIHLRDQVAPSGRLPQIKHDLLVTAVVGLVAVCFALLAYLLRFRPRAAVVPLALLCLLAAGDTVRFARSMMPSGTTATLYPATEAHAWLSEHLDHERYAADGLTMFPNSNALFDLRSANGHAFHATSWRSVLVRADPGAFSASPTFSQLHAEPDVVTSPALDRLGVRYFVANPTKPVVGERTSTGALAERTTIDGTATSTTLSCTGPARAITVAVASVVPHGRLLLEARRADGTLFWQGSRLLEELPAGGHDLAVPADGIPAGERWTLRAAMEGDGRLDLAALQLGVVRPADDGLAVAYADDVTIYERSRALPRIRYAARSMVVSDPVDSLASAPRDTVVLEEGDADETPGDATLSIVRDGPDVVEVDANVDGDGHLVVADAMQRGWRATVDGVDVPLVHADGAGVAVPLPGGRHEVVLTYVPPGRTAGLLITTVGWLAVVALLISAAWRWLRRDEGAVRQHDRR